MTKPSPHSKSDYVHFLTIPTRWNDNDIYGHVNNAVYYFYFDTIVNQFLISKGVLALGQSKIIGLVVETSCSYFAPVSFPDTIEAGLRVAKIGNSSIQYEIGLFNNNETTASAQGRFVHVYVDADTRRPVSLTTDFKAPLSKLLTQET